MPLGALNVPKKYVFSNGSLIKTEICLGNEREARIMYIKCIPDAYKGAYRIYIKCITNININIYIYIETEATFMNLSL